MPNPWHQSNSLLPVVVPVNTPLAPAELLKVLNVAAAATRHATRGGVLAKETDLIAPFSASAEGRTIATTNEQFT